jgi:hypothetical protein
MSQFRWPIGFVFMAALLFAAGCDKTGKANDNRDKSKEAHAHPSEGPHGGALIEWGEEDYHLEFTVDHKNQEAIVYILDDTARRAKPIQASELTLTIKQSPPATVKLVARPEKDDTTGASSRFAGKHELFAGEQKLEGEIKGEVDGKPYVGDFKEKAHKH